MSAPHIWIILPLIIAGISFFLRRWKNVISISITIFVLLLTLIAWLIPFDELVVIGPWAFTIADRIEFAGRQFILSNADRSTLVVINLLLTFFFAGSLTAGASKQFVPVGLAMSTMLIASLAVEPFLYAALFIQVAVLISIPLLSPPGKSIEPGVLRYLVLMSFGFLFMLVGGWLLSSVELTVTEPTVLYPVLIFFGLGFAFLLAIFPLNTWIPMLTERTHPYAVIFLLSILPLIVITLLLRFTSGYPWLLDLEIIQFLGLLMVVTGGLWAAFQRDLGRFLGYAVIIEIGRSILAISQPAGLPIYAAMFLPRILAFAVWGLSLSLIREQAENLKFQSVQGLARQSVILPLGVLVAHFSIAGFPLLAGFPVLLSLLDQLVQSSTTIAFFTLLGAFGLMVGGLRTLAVFVMGPVDLPAQENTITLVSKVYLVLGITFLFLAGIFPHWFYTILAEIAEIGVGQ